jgi:TRAP-type C4-dicarboxylate transport system permease small subunit
MEALDRLLARLARFNDAACVLGKWGSLTLVGLMTAAILLQVFFRYVLGGALTWTEEVGRYMMVWMTFLVAPIAYRTGANVALEVLAAHIHGRVAEVLKIVLNLLVITFIVVFFYESLGLIGRGFKIKAATFPVQMAWIFMILPASFVVMFTVAIELIGRGVQRLVDPTRPPESPPPGLLAVD